MGCVKIDYYIDVGINSVVNPDGTSRLIPDVDFNAVKTVAGIYHADAGRNRADDCRYAFGKYRFELLY